ncbi:tRNA (adenosine(37)-N6)-threonylcarbamoyltransferase complex dimerization subunit type 1 TsaB [Rhizobium sp. L1K21]|uniref:tRNA (adenosine(37)-N6)-threonylcarbamoyltransferase complex dimerization subunit type 1 TsaB n=1 Tax=Rhizobium sp. L1K21 TaxID=2954933 RepID=UPI002092210D|nr:tRNA (adenosine(37)-N6)-threonylcarbamoyltransferase complex dimerization subunit type 1 TsaB [Rhizobium sp. L1K21]MCO6187377.1 tRNA (adenosine(37)-N6)-threonylcarbamoyltransferase complex dimerization subunit type 1 TsaB [Rhizobium sp. L1K21]
MKLLAIDTSGADCSAAVYDCDAAAVLAERQETIGKGHAEKLMGMIDAVLHDCGLDMAEIGKIGVVVGPGSFTGIRVGVSVARGFGLALGVPLASVTTLETLAYDAVRQSGSEEPILTVMDAKRGQVYLQLFGADGGALDDPFVMEIDAARAFYAANPARLAGSGSALLRGFEASPEIDHLPIDVVAAIAARKATGKPAPLYLRGPDAKPQAGFAVARQ